MLVLPKTEEPSPTPTVIPIGGTRDGILSLDMDLYHPSQGSLQIGLSLVHSGRVRILLFDIAGEKVRTLLDADLPAGSQSLRWDGENSFGQRVASGLYLLVADTPDGRMVRKIAVLK